MNGEKNGVPNSEATQFTKENQPDPKAKSRGVKAHWDRKKEAQKLMDTAKDYMDMTLGQLHDARNDMEKNPNKYTLREKKIIDYLLEDKNTTDYLDRHVSKAPTNLEVQGSLTLGDMKKLFEDDPNDNQG